MHPLTLLLLTPAAAVLLPGPSGPYGVGFSQHVIPHITQHDPTPGPANELLVHLYYPTRGAGTPVPYFGSDKMARIWNGLVNMTANSTALTQLATDLRGNASYTHATGRPTVFFSPGAGINAWMYYGQLADLASRGYAVVAIDHPGEPPLLQWPNGTESVGFDIDLALTQELIDKMHAYRITDLEAVIAWFAKLHGPFEASCLFTMGHSLGGSAAMAIMPDHPGVKAGVNVDGSLQQAAITTDVHRPVFMFSSVNHTDPSDPSWAEFPARQTAWWEKIAVYGAGHADYSDITTWRELLGLERLLQPEFGPTGGPRTTDIVRQYLATFFGWVEGKSGKGVLAGPSLRWWEVVYENGSDFLHR